MARVEHKVIGDAIEAHEKALNVAIKSEKFMTAVWHVRDGKLELITGAPTTWQFPVGDFDEAINQLKRACDEEATVCGAASLPDEPLPIADFMKHIQDDQAERNSSPASFEPVPPIGESDLLPPSMP